MIGYYRVLGPVDAVFGGEVVSFGAAKSRVLLAALLLRANHYVSTGQLVSTLWGADPPTSARATLHTYIMRLRKSLQQYQPQRRCPLRTEPGGYLFEASDDTLDLISFDAELAASGAAARAGDCDAELDHLTRALAIWRGPALSNVDCDPLHRDEVPRLTEQRLKAIERRIDIQLAMGHAGELVGELRACTSEYPRRERFWRQLIEALYRTGRQAEALAAYHTVRRHLADELGVDPGPELRGLQLSILQGDDMPDPLTAIAKPTVALSGPRQPACQLPIDIGELVGRREPLDLIGARLRPRSDRTGPAIAAIGGAPGVGKTALAVHVAWQLRPHFPDGQWFVDLGAARATARPPLDVLAELLQAAGVSRDNMPYGVGALVGALRTAMAGRRILLVLDDADGVDQVVPLLPSSPGCAVLVTSRASLVGLTALHGGQSWHLAVLTPSASVRLLGQLLGPDRVDREPEAAMELARVCGGLPQALRIAAAQLGQNPDQSLASYLDAMMVHGPLDRLSVGLPHPLSLRATIQAAYDRLTASDQRSFRGLIRLGGKLTADQVADTLAVSTTAASRLLDRLAEAHLVRWVPGDGYELPELERSFASHAGVPPEELEQPLPGISRGLGVGHG